jgi:hypothetical protein
LSTIYRVRFCCLGRISTNRVSADGVVVPRAACAGEANRLPKNRRPSRRYFAMRRE